MAEQSERSSSSSLSVRGIRDRRLLNTPDPDGSQEARIDAIAKRLSRYRNTENGAQVLVQKERLAGECLRFFFVVGADVAVRDDGVLHEGAYSQVDDVFLNALVFCLDCYDHEKGLFCHYLRSKYGHLRADCARSRESEDRRYGGLDGYPAGIEEPIDPHNPDSPTFGDRYQAQSIDPSEEKQREKEEEESGSRLSIMARTIDLITRFLESSGKQANITRKFYVRLFFTEFVTKATKTRSRLDLDDLLAEERRLFKTIDLPFQDSYTVDICRSIYELWDTDFVEGITPIPKAVVFDDSESSKYFDWRVPTSFYLAYLKANGHPASDALLSQQRGNYRKLIQDLRFPA